MPSSSFVPDPTLSLLLCLREDSDLPLPALNRLSPAGWDALVAAAARLGVAGLLYHRFEQGRLSLEIPAGALLELQHLSLATALGNMNLYAELRRALSAFAQVDVPAIVLKGGYLAQAVYGDVALRSMGDLDLLVREEDLERAESALRELGYRLESDREEDQDRHHHFRYLLPENGIYVELHWDLQGPARPSRLDLASAWERARPVKLAGAETLALSPEDLLLHACLHLAASHQFTFYGLRSLCDLAQICRALPLSWDGFLPLVRQARAARPAYLALRLGRDLLGAAVPVEVLQALEPPGFQPAILALAAEFALLGPKPMSPQALAEAGSLPEPLPRRTVLGGRLRTLFRIVFPSLATLSRVYPLPPGANRLNLGYYYLERMVKRSFHLPKALGLLRGDPQSRLWLDRRAKGLRLVDWLSQGWDS